MISNHVRFHPLSKKITLFVGSILLTNIVASHKCYVCRPANSDSIPSCDQFEPTNLNFMRECPSSSKGCSIITNGTILTRTCEKIAFNQCQVANNVEYCYCTTDLCNSEKLPKKEQTTPTDETDDDSDEDGSGAHIIEPVTTSSLDVTKSATPTIQHNVTKTSNTQSSMSTPTNNMHQVNILLTFCIIMVYRYEFLSYI